MRRHRTSSVPFLVPIKVQWHSRTADLRVSGELKSGLVRNLRSTHAVAIAVVTATGQGSTFNVQRLLIHRWLPDVVVVIQE